jgi:hypothetical protein
MERAAQQLEAERQAEAARFKSHVREMEQLHEATIKEGEVNRLPTAAAARR